MKMKITLAQLNPTVGALKANAELIIKTISEAKAKKSDLIIFSELVLCGYPPLDLLFTPGFLDEIERQLKRILLETKGIVAVVGTPRKNSDDKEKFLFNSLAIMQEGSILGFYDKQLLPTYDVFDERRYFEPGKHSFTFSLKGKKIALTICEDIWQHSQLLKDVNYSIDPIYNLKGKGVDLFINASASPYSRHKSKVRLSIGHSICKTLHCPVILCNQVGANDGLLFDGNSFGLNPDGALFFQAKSFEEEVVTFELPNHNNVEESRDEIAEVYHALVIGTRDYFHKSGFKKAVFGLSGGIDSALVAYILKEALGKENVLALALPSRFSSPNSTLDAHLLAKQLDVEIKEISIEPIFSGYLNLLEPVSDLTKENLQARIRGMILMAFSNQSGALLVNTANKSELAMGYSTIYGDMCGALSILGDLYKTTIYELARFVGIPETIIQKPPSAELKPNQKDSDTLPPYSLLDPILRDYIEEGHTDEKIAKHYSLDLSYVQEIIRTIHQNEYKRKQAPLILRISEKALTPLVGRFIPTVHHFY